MPQRVEQILSKENMTQTYRKVKANKGASGIDKVSMDEDDAYRYLEAVENQTKANAGS